MVIFLNPSLRVEAKGVFKRLGTRKLAFPGECEKIHQREWILVLVFLEIYHWTKAVGVLRYYPAVALIDIRDPNTFRVFFNWDRASATSCMNV